MRSSRKRSTATVAGAGAGLPHRRAYSAAAELLPPTPGQRHPGQRFSILVGELSQERLAIAPASATGDRHDRCSSLGKGESPLKAGDAALAIVHGPTWCAVPFWHKAAGEPLVHYSNQHVDAALDRSNTPSTTVHKPASPRVSAPSSTTRRRFSCRGGNAPGGVNDCRAGDPGADVLSDIQQWRLAATDTTRSRD